MHQLRPYRQTQLDATQAAARAITIAVFLTIGLSNYAVFGSKLRVLWVEATCTNGLGGVVEWWRGHS